MKKILSVILSLVLTCSYIFVPSSTAVAINSNIQILDINSSIGKVTDYFLPNGTIPQIIFIQDLHSSSSVQKNISEIINTVYKNYEVNKILIEGGNFEKIDTEILDLVSNYNITEDLLKDGVLSGSEYYYMKYNNKADIWGIENFDIYLDNLNRAKQILSNNEYYLQLHKQLEIKLSKNIHNYKNLYKLAQFNLNDVSTFKYINQPILQYKTLYKYWTLLNNNFKYNVNKISKQEKLFLNQLKNKIDYKSYKEYVDLTKKENKIKVYEYIYHYLKQNEQYQTQYKDLYNFLEYTITSNNINFEILLNEQQNYFIDYCKSEFINKEIRDSVFVIKMTNLLKSFLDLTITENDYKYFVNNYNKYISLLTKYLTSKNFYEYENILLNVQSIFAYHNYNIKRTGIFVKNILNVLENQNDKLQVNVVVTGGFHSSMKQLMKENNISYVVVMPHAKDNNNFDSYRQSIINFDVQAIQGPRITTLVDQTLIKHIIKKATHGNLEINNVVAKLNEAVSQKKYSIKFTYDEDKERLVIDRKNNGNKIGITHGKYKFIFSVKNGKVVLDDNKSIQIVKKTTAKDKRNIKLSKKNKYYLTNIFKAIKDFFDRKRQIQNAKTETVLYQCQGEEYHSDIKVDDKLILEIKKIFGNDIDINNILQELCVRATQYLSLSENNQPYHIDGDISICLTENSKYLFEYDQKNKKILINKALFEQNVIQTKALQEYKTIPNDELHKIFIKLALYHGIVYSMTSENFTKKELYVHLDKLPHRFLMEEFNYILDNIVDEEDRNDKEKIKRIKESIVNDLNDSKLFDKGKENVFLKKFSNYYTDIDSIIVMLKRKRLKGNIAGEEEIKDIFYGLTVSQQQYIFEQMFQDSEDSELISLINGVQISKKAIVSYYEAIVQKQLEIKDTQNYAEQIKNNIREVRLTTPVFKEICKDEKISKQIESILKEYKKLFDNIGKITTNDDIDINKLYTDLEDGIVSGLTCMQKRMPTWMFVEYLNDEFSGLQHSLDILYYTCKILENSWNIKDNNKIDFKLYAYAALMHDASCLLLRDNNAENSSAFARAIFKTTLEEEDLEKVCTICLGQKKIVEGQLRPEHIQYIEARLMHDSESICSDCKDGLERIYSMWEQLPNGVMFNDELTDDDRTDLISGNVFRCQDGGDCLNDLIRHYKRSQQPISYITQGAKNFIWKNYGTDDFVKFIESKKFGKSISYHVKKGKIKDVLISKKLNVNKVLNTPQSIIFSDIHGGYKRILVLLYNSLFNDIKNFNDIDELPIDELKKYEDRIISKLKDKNIPVYILGDILDRGDNIVESFEFVERLSKELGDNFHFVIGNHDLYCFMNLIGVHLPCYKGYKGIKQGYKDFNGQDINKLLQQMLNNTTNLQFSNMQYWEQKLSEYMKYADEQQSILKEDINKLTSLFKNTFGYINEKDKDESTDILFHPEGTIFAKDKELFEFMKKIYGRNIAGKAYIGLKGAYKMSINWWLDRQEELQILKNKYPSYATYFNELESVINKIIKNQKNKYSTEVANNNEAWKVIDAIMYGNYETTEWNALDWGYHSGWAAGSKGLIAQRNNQIKTQLLDILNDNLPRFQKKAIIKQTFNVRNLKKFEKIKIDITSLDDILACISVDSSNYLEDPFFNRIKDFYIHNFNIYEKDDNDNYYMHCIFPVDDEGDICIGRIDENGNYVERDDNGKLIKGLVYDGHYQGKAIFNKLSQISEKIENYNGDVLSIINALKLLTSVYADNTTKIKPKYINNYDKNFGLNNILKNIGISRLFVGHNPVEKFKSKSASYLNPLNSSDPIATVLINIDNGLASGANEHGMIVTAYENGIMFNISDSNYIGGFYRELENTGNSGVKSNITNITYKKDNVLVVKFIDTDEDETKQYQTLESLEYEQVQGVGIKIVKVDDNEVTDNNKIIQKALKEEIKLLNGKSISVITIKVSNTIDINDNVDFYQELVQVLRKKFHKNKYKQLLCPDKNVFGKLFSKVSINKDTTEKQLITSLIRSCGDGYNGIVDLYDISKVRVVESNNGIENINNSILDLLSAS